VQGCACFFEVCAGPGCAQSVYATIDLLRAWFTFAYLPCLDTCIMLQ